MNQNPFPHSKSHVVKKIAAICLLSVVCFAKWADSFHNVAVHMRMWTISHTQFVKTYLFLVTISEVQSKKIVNYRQEIHYAALLCTTQDTGKDSYK